MRSKGKSMTKNPPSKNPQQDVNRADSGELSLYKVVSVSRSNPDLTEDLSSSSTPYYHMQMAPKMQMQPPRTERIDQSREIIPTNHHNLVSRHKSKQDAAVEAHIHLGLDAMTQTDDMATEKESSNNCDKSPSYRTYSGRLESLARELSEIRSLLERLRY